MCVTPDGQHVVTASGDNTARACGCVGRLTRAHAQGAHGAVLSVCVTPDGQHVVTASLDKTARVWLLSDGSLVRTLEGHTYAVCGVTPDGQYVVTASEDKTARVAAVGRLARAHARGARGSG